MGLYDEAGPVRTHRGGQETFLPQFHAAIAEAGALST